MIAMLSEKRGKIKKYKSRAPAGVKTEGACCCIKDAWKVLPNHPPPST